MKNQYVGDINDFWKYTILSAFAKHLPLTVCWMLTPNDERDDGEHTAYLRNPEYQEYSPDIFDSLKRIVESGRRNVEYVEGLFPANFCNKLFEISAYNSLVFLDPDNGIEVKSKPWGKKGSEHYIYWTTIKKLWDNANSLIVYQHFPRVNRREYIENLTQRIKWHCPLSRVGHIYTSAVDFALIFQPHNVYEMGESIKELKRTPHLNIVVARGRKYDTPDKR